MYRAIVFTLSLLMLGCIQRSAPQCPTTDSCSVCLQTQGCGWCHTTRRCVGGTSLGPDQACGAFVFQSCSDQPIARNDAGMLGPAEMTCLNDTTLQLGLNAFVIPNRTSVYEGSCGGSSAPEIVAVFVPQQSKAYAFETRQRATDPDPVIYIRREGFLCEGAEVECESYTSGLSNNNVRLTVAMTAGTRYYVFLEAKYHGGSLFVNVE